MNDRSSYLIPLAIIFAGAVLAIALYAVRAPDPTSPLQHIGAVRPVSETDHIVGSPTAPLVIIEYSDIDCEYCKDFQRTLAQLMAEYGPGGQVAWVYRHFPLINLHEHAATHAEAAECVAEQDESRFFLFIDALQQAAPGGTEFMPTGHAGVVENLGLSVSSFEECMQSDRMVERVTQDFENAVDAGGTGTPYSIILVRGSDPIVVTGALPYDAMKEVVETALKSIRE